MSRRPNVAHPREKEVEREIQAARKKRDAAMKKKKAKASQETPEPVVYSYSRGPVEMEPKVKAWLKREIAAQNKRYEAIYREQEELSPLRDQWVKEFFERISGPRGFSVDAGQRRTIKKSELPKRPRRKWRVVW